MNSKLLDTFAYIKLFQDPILVTILYYYHRYLTSMFIITLVISVAIIPYHIPSRHSKAINSG